MKHCWICITLEQDFVEGTFVIYKALLVKLPIYFHQCIIGSNTPKSKTLIFFKGFPTLDNKTLRTIWAENNSPLCNSGLIYKLKQLIKSKNDFFFKTARGYLLKSVKSSLVKKNITISSFSTNITNNQLVGIWRNYNNWGFTR